MKHLFGLLWTMLLVHVSMSIQAQNPTYLCELRNDVQVSSTVYEFDIYLLRTGAIPFEYAAGQYGILINPLIKNGGVITASIVAGSSDPILVTSSQNPTSISFLDVSNCIRIAGRVPPGAGNGAIISAISPGTKVCRVRLTNTVAFGQYSPDLSWTTNTIYPTQINAYVAGVNTAIMVPSSQTTNNLVNPILNQSFPLPYAVTGSGSYCTGSAGLTVGLANSESGTTYTLYKDAVAQVPTVNGTGSAISFGLQTAGTYTVFGTNGFGTTQMTGSAVITENPVPAAPSVSVVDNCGSSSLTASAFTGTLLWSTTETTPTINVTAAGPYTVTQTVNGCTSLAGTGTAAPKTVPASPIIGTITQPNCVLATGSVVLSGLPAGNWTINPGAIAGSTSSTTISGLVAGTYNFTVTNDVGCISVATSNVVINAQPIPSAPTVGTITQPTCASATGSVILSGLPAGNWTINPGAIAGSTTSTTISGLVAGTYNYTVTNSVGCTSVASANVVINAQPATPAAPTVGTITQPTCALATGSVVLSGLPAGNWTINPGAIAGSTTSTTISGLVAGTYNYTVTNSVGCTSVASANVVINAQPAIPAAPTVGTITQPTCASATGSVILSGLPAGNWTINPGAIAGSTTSTTISGLVAGTYNYTVTNSVGCTSVASANVVINAQPAAPAAPTVGTITQPTCALATGSVVLSGLPSGNWTINPGAIAGSTTSTTISGLVAGTYNYTVTNSVGCTSVASANVVINAQPATPAAPTVGTITQPTCASATGSVILSGLPAGNWTINPGAIAGSTTTTTISGLVTGTYNYTVTNSVGCTSVASANVVINAQPATPSAPTVGTITQPTCASATGSVILSGLPAGNWTINPGAIAGSTTSTTISGLVAGTYNYTVTNSAGCISVASADIIINAQPATPAAPTVGTITQPTCATATGSVILSGLPAGNWTINPGAIAGSTASTTISGLAAGTYNYTVTNSVGCISVASADIIINAQPATPAAPTVGTITQPTCATATGSVILSGLPAGNWTINPGAIAGSTTSTTISGLAAGTYNYTVTNSVGCISLASADVIINAQPATPAAPTVGTITQPTCASATGSVILSGLPAGNWTINPGAIAGSTTSTTISGLVAGTYNYTVTNSVGCISLASADVIINAQPATPAAPTVGTITQPTCALATGSVVLSGLPAGNWTINPGAIAGSTSSTTISGLVAGTYNYTVTNSDGCTSVSSGDVVITTQPVTPVVMLGSDVTICASNSVTLDAGNPGSAYLWSPGGQTTQTVTIDTTGLGLGAHTISVLVTNTDLCSATGSVIVTFDPCSGVEPVSTDISTLVFPNPTTGTIYVTVKGYTENPVLNIYDINGRIIYTEKYNNSDFINKTIDLKYYPKGLYFIKFISDNYSHVEKLIIE